MQIIILTVCLSCLFVKFYLFQLKWKFKMGKLADFRILLNNSEKVFYIGEKISGQVLVDLIQPMEMRGITLKLKGQYAKLLMIQFLVYC